MKEKSIIIIPLHLPLNYPCDYINQTINVLKNDFLVLAYDFYNPISWKNLFKVDWLKKINQLKKNNKGFIVFNSPAVLPFQRFKFINKINQFLGYVFLSLLIFFLKKRVIIWQFFPLITNNFLKKLFNQFFLYDCIDFLDKKIYGENIIKKELKLINVADYVSFNSKYLYEVKTKDLKGKNNKFIITYCGCNFKNFDLPFEDKKEKIAIFYGFLNYRIDSDLLRFTILNNKEWFFLIIGPIDKINPPKKDFYQILELKNVRYLEKLSKEKLVYYLKKSRIGLIPYNTSYNFVKYSNPMKAYEYLASGIPVLSTKILALENYSKEIVYTTNNYKDFSKALNKITKNWNYQKAKIAKKIAQKNSWENKIKLILKKLIYENKKIGIITSNGGHLFEIIQLKKILDKYSNFWVTKKDIDSDFYIKKEKVYYGYFPDSRNFLNLIKNFFLAFKILNKEKPQVLISSGAGIAIPFFIIGKIFFKTKLIFIEPYDFIRYPSLTGKIVYNFVDLFIILHPIQKKWYKRGILIKNLIF